MPAQGHDTDAVVEKDAKSSKMEETGKDCNFISEGAECIAELAGLFAAALS